VEENSAADRLQLTADQLARLTALPLAAGDTHTQAGLQMLER
jgi:hypothetical protein